MLNLENIIMEALLIFGGILIFIYLITKVLTETDHEPDNDTKTNYAYAKHADRWLK